MQKTINLIWKSGKKRIQKIRKKCRSYNALTDAKITDKMDIL
jgi:3-keto-L-gulonate-6-phosphate decarboxylase